MTVLNDDVFDYYNKHLFLFESNDILNIWDFVLYVYDIKQENEYDNLLFIAHQKADAVFKSPFRFPKSWDAFALSGVDKYSVIMLMPIFLNSFNNAPSNKTIEEDFTKAIRTEWDKLSK